jgi:hypothetical protein
MTFSYVKVNDQIYFEKFYHLPPLNNYPSNFVFTSSYTWSYNPISSDDVSPSGQSQQIPKKRQVGNGA